MEPDIQVTGSQPSTTATGAACPLLQWRSTRIRPCFIGIDPETHTVSALHHAAIDTHIDPALIGVADNDVVRRADVTATVARVPEGRGKSFEIYGVAFLNAFQNRSVFDDLGGNQRGGFALVAPETKQFQGMNVEGQIQRETKTSHRLDGIGADPIACGITRDVIEDGHGTAALAQELCETAHIPFQIGSFDILNFSDRVRRFDEIFQR